MKKRMREKLLIIFFILFPTLSLNAQSKNINFFTAKMPKLSLQGAISVPFDKDFRNPSISSDFILAADFKELRCDSGIKVQNQQLDITNRLFYMPTFFDVFQLGLGINHHFYRFSGLFSENDLILSTRFKLISDPVFSLEAAPGVMFKYASVDAVKQYKPYIFNFTYHFSILCNWNILNKANIWCALNMQDYFDYPLAISLFQKIGADYTITPGIVVGVDYTLKFIDVFFSAVYLNESLLRFSFKVEI